MADASEGSRFRHWLLLIIGASVGPLLFVSAVILVEFRRAHYEKVTAHLGELVEKHRQNVDSFLTAKLGDIQVLSTTFTFEELGDEAFLQQRLAILQQAYDPVFVDLGVINAEGMQVAYAGPFRLGHADYSDAGWFQEAMRRDFFISDVFPGLRGLPHFIVAVRRSQGDETWILRATIDFVAFNDLVEKIRIGRTGFAFILNRQGEFQTNAPAELLLDPGTYERFLLDQAADSRGVRVTELEDESGQENIYVVAALKGGSWLLVYQQAAAEAFADFHRAFNVTLVIIVIAGAAIVGVAYFMARKLVSTIAEAERQTQIMSKQIVETGKLAAVGELAAGIAHEINNPVAIIVEEAGWIEDLLDDKDSGEREKTEEFRRALGQIKNQGGRCKQITHKLLSFARKTDARVHDVNLYDLVEEMVALSAQRAKYSNVEIRTALQSNLPTIQASLSELQQVLLNLINNALDAMERKGGVLEITVKFVEGNLWIYVADTGPGIPEANLERIFDPFFTTKPVGKGTGLGLSICYGIVTKMNGEIDAQSVVGSGTTFRIRLPIHSMAEADDKRSAQSAAAERA
jgi:two-component system NtrC family sensor kinase